ncbi:MAG: AAA family ATPase [Porphyromonadaceae bacterium]|nr:AAA family ATPase [Porphyromonadaceae bacterium]
MANQKGGVAKTTVCHNLSVALALKKRKVLMVDLDGQASLSFCAGIQDPMKYDGCNIVALLQKRSNVAVEKCIHSVGASPELNGYLFIIPSIIDLSSMESEMYARTSRERILATALRPILGDYDYIIIDCPPQLGLMTINALSCAHYVIIPCKTDELSYRGLTQLMDTIKDVQEYVNPNLQIYGVIPTLYQQRVTSDKNILARLESEYRVVARMKLAAVAKKGLYDGISVVELNPTHEISVSMMELANKIVTELEGTKE